MGRVLLSVLADEEIRQLYGTTRIIAAATERTKTSLDDVIAELARVRQDGWCLVDQELEWGLRSVAVPVMRSGRVFAALNVATANVAESPVETRERVLPALLATAATISEILQATPPHLHPVVG